MSRNFQVLINFVPWENNSLTIDMENVTYAMLCSLVIMPEIQFNLSYSGNQKTNLESQELSNQYYLHCFIVFFLQRQSLNSSLSRAKEIGCNNAETPDMFGHYREAKFTMTKHHWWWKVRKKKGPLLLKYLSKFGALHCKCRNSHSLITSPNYKETEK